MLKRKTFIRSIRVLLYIFSLAVTVPFYATAQIVTLSALRSSPGDRLASETLLLPALRLPAFDTDSARIEMEMESEKLRMYVFAHEFLADVDIIKTGKSSVLEDGIQVWRYRVRSSGAKSISFFFDRFELPEGALLYIYDSFNPENRIGGFGAVNNNNARVLPTMPIAADDVVIEVQSPVGTAPILHLSKVNHGVRELDFLRLSIPKYTMGGPSDLSCTPEIACHPSFVEIGKGVVLIAIDGVAIGTGTLVNNTSGNGRPYILTAAHVLSKNFRSNTLVQNARNTIVFFNYSSPTCSGEIAPNTVQTLAGANLIGYQEKSDVTLLEMYHKPPREYDVYYAGWNASDHTPGPYVNIHHPKTYTKRVSIYNNSSIRVVSYPSSSLPFEQNQHLEIPSWTIGTTAPGSSGSPLFDANDLIIGGLSGGNSFCNVLSPDYFFALQKVWERRDPESNKIINALDPSGQRRTICYGSRSKEVQAEPLRRISNITMGRGESIHDNMPQLNRQQLMGGEDQTMIGEYFLLRQSTKIHGLYMMVSTTSGVINSLTPDSEISVQVYEEESKKKLGEGKITLIEAFPKLTNHPGTNPDKLPVMAELFLRFPQPLFVSSDGGVIFGVTKSSIPDGIDLLHQQHANADRSTLYWMNGTSWEKAPVLASLWIEPLISHRLIHNDQDEQPGVKIEHMPGLGLVITVSQKSDSIGSIDVYSLQGQRLYSAEISGGRHILPRAPFEGIGVVLIHIKVDGKKETIKALFPKDVN